MKRHIILFISILFILCSCGTGKHIINNNDYTKQYARELIVTKAQLDSVCVADTLTQHFKDWYRAAFVDYETNKSMEKRLYVKSTINKRVFYILSPYDENRFKLIIRTEE